MVAAATAEIRLGKPNNLPRFEKKIIGDIIVYIDKLFAEDQKINIYLTKLLGIKKLYLEIS